ncbi:CDON [Bugula neritina]|uniref:CDON n=1 Tax=Bugula neritina TaxID=10212 RepID=A0A7J7KL21_BUGNE|nr:CDON [Bugula neritina]
MLSYLAALHESLLTSFNDLIICVLKDPPTITSNTANGVVKLKSVVELYCNPGDDQYDTPVTWLKDGQVVPTVSADPKDRVVINSTGGLRIPAVRTSHTGSWQCVRHQLVSQVFVLTKAKIKPFSTTLKDQTITVIVGATALIPCQPPASRPTAHTVFEINGQTIDESRGNHYLLSSGDLQITNVQQEHAGAYKCVAINSVLNDKVPAPFTITLEVQVASQTPVSPEPISWSLGPQVTAMEGDTLVLPCVYRANPLGSTSWERYQQDLPLNRTSYVGDALRLSNIQPTDQGTYNCIIDNGNIPTTITYLLSVYSKPKVSPRSSIKHAVEFRSTEIECSLRNDSAADVEYQWYFNGEDLQHYEGSLTISNLTSDDAGLYQCIVGNDVGSDSGYVKLHVVKEPTTTTTTSTTTTTTTSAPVVTTSASAVTAAQPAPGQPSVEQIRREGVKLTWSTQGLSNVLSYWVKAKTAGDDWLVVLRDIPRQTSYVEVNNDLVAGQKYKFIIVALYRNNIQIDSAPSVRFRLDPTFGDEETTPITASAAVTRCCHMLLSHAAVTCCCHMLLSHATVTCCCSLLLAVTLSSASQPPAAPVTQLTATLQVPVCVNQCRPPAIITGLENATRNSGSDVRLMCIVNDHDAEYSWYKDGVQLSAVPARRLIQMNIVVITQLTPADSGWYSCQVANQYGSTNSTAYLRVLSRPPAIERTPSPTSPNSIPVTSTTTTPSRTIVAPTMPVVEVLTSTEVRITYTPVSGGVPVIMYKVQYKRLDPDGWSQWFTLRVDSMQTNEYRLAGGIYRFRMGAVYVDNQVEVSPSTRKVKLLKAAVSSAPKFPPAVSSVVQTGRTQLTVVWPSSKKELVERYIVEYKVWDMPADVTWSQLSVLAEPSYAVMEATITGLSPGEKYGVRVTAENSYGQSPPSFVLTHSLSANYNTLGAVLPTGDNSLPTLNSGDNPGSDTAGTNSDQKYINADKDKNIFGLTSDSDLLYIILGSVLGLMILILIVFVAVCGFKQRQRRRTVLARGRGSHNKFADASKVLYGEQLKQPSVNGSTQFVTMNGGVGPMSAPSNGTLSSVHSQRISLNINPLNELDESYAANENHQDIKHLDYNLMQHYPHYNSNGSRHAPSSYQQHPHSSHHSVIDAGSQHDAANGHHYSHGSLPHYNVHQQYERSRSNTPQFSTFLPRTTKEGSPAPAVPTHYNKLPHPQGLRPVPHCHSPVPSDHPPVNQQRKRRKKRSQRDQMLSHSNPGSGRDYNTNTDLSSGEGTGAEEYSQMLPPPPVLPSSYSHSVPSTAEGDCDETYPLNTNTMDTNTGDFGYKDEQV